jgi:hypothetical protein
MSIVEGLFIVGLFGSRRPTASQSQERIAAPGFTENDNSAGFQNSPQFDSGGGNVEMMQDRVTPNGVE